MEAPEKIAADLRPLSRLPLSYVDGLPLSFTARTLLLHAGTELVATLGHTPIINTRSLLGAFLDQQESGAFNWFFLVIGDAAHSWPALRAKYYSRTPNAEPPLGATELSADLTRVLQLAGELAEQTTGAQEIDARHLFGALLLHQPAEPSSAHRLFDELACDLPRVREGLCEVVPQISKDDSAVWRTRLGVSVELVVPRWDLARVVNDRVAGVVPLDQDLLDASRPALRFAKLLAARDVKPPIALGLFGNWGSGKTFFMGLMQSHVNLLTAGQNREYVERAAQIEFNAWHYHDTNLWASIAVHIFDGLAKALTPASKRENAVKDTRTKLNQEIASSKNRKAEASAERDHALVERAKSKEQLEKKKTEREAQVLEHVTLQLRAAWELLKADESVLKTQAELGQLAKELGLSAGVEQLAEVRERTRELQALTNQQQTLIAAIAARFKGGHRFGTLLRLALLVAVLLLLGWVGDRLPVWATELCGTKVTLPGASTLLQVTILVSTAVAWATTQMRRASKVLRDATALDDKIQDKVRELEASSSTGASARTEEQQLRDKISALDNEILAANEALRQADALIAEATAEVDRIDRGGLVYDFVQERVASSQYANHLGLVSTIRRDLESLDELLAAFAKDGYRPIERVILYIDDLDRCETNKVIEVLQAVHLLLAFKIFHVVVGVDARSLRRALDETYARGQPNSAGPTAGSFSAHDYLEKIFQIPYALAPLQPEAYKSLVGGMIQTRSEWTRERDAKRAAAAAQERAAASVRAQSLEPAPSSGAGNAEQGASPRKTTPPADTSASAVVFFEDHEEAFIRQLHAFVDRPRLARRFINIYRLLRARATDEQEAHTFAAQPESVDYRVALLLLAISVGHPDAAAAFFQALLAAKLGTWTSFLKGHGALAIRSEPQERLLSTLTGLDTLDIPQDLSRYRVWIPRVACFSFDVPAALGGGR